jgi:hypothetical protein
MPPRKGVIRAISYLTGYHGVVVPEGVRFTYVTQADVKGACVCVFVCLCVCLHPLLVLCFKILPRAAASRGPAGKLPKWLINVATTSGAPSLLAKILKVRARVCVCVCVCLSLNPSSPPPLSLFLCRSPCRRRQAILRGRRRTIPTSAPGSTRPNPKCPWCVFSLRSLSLSLSALSLSLSLSLSLL